MKVRPAISIVLAAICACLFAMGSTVQAQEVVVGSKVKISRSNGAEISGEVLASTPKHIEIKLKFGSVKVPLEEITACELQDDAAETADTAAPTEQLEAEEIIEGIEETLNLIAAREIISASKQCQALVAASRGSPFVTDAEAQLEFFKKQELCELHNDVKDLESLAEYLEIIAAQACTRCGGPGENRCKTCRGKGETPCGPCRASGKVKCDQCKGKGKSPCVKCNGSARMECDDCGSRDGCRCPGSYAPKLGLLRRFREGDNAPVRNDCKGRLIYVDCPECTNSGKDTCDTCDAGPTGVASGFNYCDRCESKGKLQCDACRGDKTTKGCVTCNGKLATRCVECQGTGRNPDVPEVTEEGR